jgi:hypothetical protein
LADLVPQYIHAITTEETLRDQLTAICQESAQAHPRKPTITRPIDIPVA